MARKRRRSVTLAQVSDLTPERVNHAGANLQWPEDKRSPQQTARILCPLDRLHEREQISERAYNAGVKFRKHHLGAGLYGRMGTVDMHRILAQPQDDLGAHTFHVTQYRHALICLGFLRIGVLEQVVCYDKTLAEVAAAQGRAPGGRGTEAVRGQLASSLEDLASLWGL
jgi:hypothetical protein